MFSRNDITTCFCRHSEGKRGLNSAAKLLVRISNYHERHFNVVGKIAICLDVDRYLHVHMRHVDEMKINNQFEHKSNFQWNEEDILMVIGKVIEKINDEIQAFLKKIPQKGIVALVKKVFILRVTITPCTLKRIAQ